MNKKIMIFVSSIFLLMLASCGTEVTNTTPTETTKTPVEVEVKTEAEPTVSAYDDFSNAPFAYREYNGQDLSNLGKQTVLYFSQASCGTCQKTDADIKSQASLPDNISILKIDYDTETELNKKYGVTTKHTFVLVDAAGNEIAKEIGLARTQDIADFVTKNSGNTAESSEETSSTSAAPAKVAELKKALSEKKDTAVETVAKTEAVTETVEKVVESAPVATTEAIEEEVETTPVAASSGGTFKNYTGAPGKESVLFFSAVWCPGCVKAEQNLKNEGSLSIDTDIYKVDYDSNKALRDKYGVTAQHTFVRIDAEGNLIKKMTGGYKSSDLTALFN